MSGHVDNSCRKISVNSVEFCEVAGNLLKMRLCCFSFNFQFGGIGKVLSAILICADGALL